MWIMSFFWKKLGNNKINNIINYGDMIQIPTREYYSGNDEVLNLLDRCKDEYLKLLSEKKILLSRELNFDNLQEVVKMYIDLLLRICVRDDDVIEKFNTSEDKNINMMIDKTKLELYLDAFSSLEQIVMIRLVSLKEIISEHRWLYIKNRNVINEVINNLSISISMFNSQKLAIKSRIDTYYIEIVNQVSMEEVLIDEKQKLIKEKLEELLFMGRLVIPEKVAYINQLDCNDILKISYLEKEIEIYVYKNKGVVNSLYLELELLDKEEKTVRSKGMLLDRISELEYKYKLFYKYGRKIITDEDLYELYRVKFDIMTIDICNGNQEFINYIRKIDNRESIYSDNYSFEYKCYLEIVRKKIEKIFRGENEVISELFKDDKVNAIKEIKKYLKNYYFSFGEYMTWSDLAFILSFDRKDGFNDYIANNSVTIPDFDYYFSNYQQNFKFDKLKINLDMYFYVADLPDSKIKLSSIEKILYTLYKFMKKHEEYVDVYKIPEGIVEIDRGLNDIDFLTRKIADDSKNKNIILPNSLRVLKSNMFFMGKVKSIRFNPKLESISSTLFMKSCISNIDSLIFENYKESHILTDVSSLSNLIRQFFAIEYQMKSRKIVGVKNIECGDKIQKYFIYSCKRSVHIYPLFKKIILIDSDGTEIVIDNELLHITYDENTSVETLPLDDCFTYKEMRKIISEFVKIMEERIGYTSKKLIREVRSWK